MLRTICFLLSLTITLVCSVVFVTFRVPHNFFFLVCLTITLVCSALFVF